MEHPFWGAAEQVVILYVPRPFLGLTKTRTGPGIFFFWNHFRLSNIPLRFKVQRFASYAEDLLLEGRGSLLDVKTIDARVVAITGVK